MVAPRSKTLAAQSDRQWHPPPLIRRSEPPSTVPPRRVVSVLSSAGDRISPKLCFAVWAGRPRHCFECPGCAITRGLFFARAETWLRKKASLPPARRIMLNLLIWRMATFHLASPRQLAKQLAYYDFLFAFI